MSAASGESSSDSSGLTIGSADLRSLRRTRFSSALRFFSISRWRLAKVFWFFAMIKDSHLAGKVDFYHGLTDRDSVAFARSKRTI